MAHFDPSSREEEAREEIAATRVARPVAATLLGSFLALLASGPALETVAALGKRSEIWAALPRADGGTLAQARAIIAELEARFDHRSELVRRVRPPAKTFKMSFQGVPIVEHYRADGKGIFLSGEQRDPFTWEIKGDQVIVRYPNLTHSFQYQHSKKNPEEYVRRDPGMRYM